MKRIKMIAIVPTITYVGEPIGDDRVDSILEDSKAPIARLVDAAKDLGLELAVEVQFEAVEEPDAGDGV